MLLKNKTPNEHRRVIKIPKKGDVKGRELRMNYLPGRRLRSQHWPGHIFITIGMSLYQGIYKSPTRQIIALLLGGSQSVNIVTVQRLVRHSTRRHVNKAGRPPASQTTALGSLRYSIPDGMRLTNTRKCWDSRRTHVVERDFKKICHWLQMLLLFFQCHWEREFLNVWVELWRGYRPQLWLGLFRLTDYFYRPFWCLNHYHHMLRCSREMSIKRRNLNEIPFSTHEVHSIMLRLY